MSTTEAAAKTPLGKLILRRTAIGLVLMLVMLVPFIALMAITKQPSSYAAMGAIVGLVAVAAGGLRIGTLTSIVMAVLAPISIVAGLTPITGAALMTLFVGRMSRFGLHRANSRVGASHRSTPFGSLRRLTGMLRVVASARYPPIDAGRVDGLDIDLEHPLREEVRDGLSAWLERPVVIDDHEATGRHLVVERVEGLEGRFVVVTIDSKDRECFDGRSGKGVLEPTLEEDDSLVEEAIASEVALDLIEINGQGRCRGEVPGLLWVGRTVGNRKSLKRISNEDAAVSVPQRLEHAHHEDAGPTSPDACLKSIPGDLLIEHCREALLEVVEPKVSNHGLGIIGDSEATFPFAAELVKGSRIPAGTVIKKETTSEHLLEEVEIAIDAIGVAGFGGG